MDFMRIGIVTYWSSSSNYGQLLQCYALQSYLKKKGHLAYLIKYKPVTHRKSLKNRILEYNLFDFFKKTLRLLYHKKECNAHLESLLEQKNINLDKIRAFPDFRYCYIDSYNYVYQSIDDLRKNPPPADVYICGSDQVWNNSLLDENSKGWFLDFGEKKIVRIAFSVSVGREYRKEELSIFKELLESFDAIGVREESVKKQCGFVGYKKVEVTMDPTLLLSAEDYKLIMKVETVMHPYLFVYVLNVYSGAEFYSDQIMSYVGRTGLDLKSVSASGYIQARNVFPENENLYPTIPEWLTLISQSTAVMTSSFHGVVFSVLFHRPFLAVLLKNQYKVGNDRILNLLESIGLSSRIFDPQKDICPQMISTIDWSAVDTRLSLLKADSYSFLKKNIYR